jgi:hypothetical protein
MVFCAEAGAIAVEVGPKSAASKTGRLLTGRKTDGSTGRTVVIRVAAPDHQSDTYFRAVDAASDGAADTDPISLATSPSEVDAWAKYLGKIFFKNGSLSPQQAAQSWNIIKELLAERFFKKLLPTYLVSLGHIRQPCARRDKVVHHFLIQRYV